MTNFMTFKVAIRLQFQELTKHGKLFVTDTDKDILWDTYLDSFPIGTNNIYKKRREYDCQHCRQFIRAAGNVVAIVNNELISLWDIQVGGYYQVVADAMAAYVKSKAVHNIFLYNEANIGVNKNISLLDSGETITWHHFHYKLPDSYVSIDSNYHRGVTKNTKEVIKRGLDTLTKGAVNTVLELIEQKSLYRGEEHYRNVKKFSDLQTQYNKLPENRKDNFCWKCPAAARIRNTVIGSLLVDLSEGKDLVTAVTAFEAKVAPMNYKRPTALITKSMVANAQKKVKELGVAEALPRRYATIDDITINNILFADRAAKEQLDVFDELISKLPDNPKNWDKVEEVSINTFINNIVPKANTIEVMAENTHTNNFVSLIAPVNQEAKPILRWGNNFSWSYNGNVTDSMKDRIKKAGGNVEGVLRFSIQWNDGDNNQNDFDAHCIEPGGNRIYYSEKYNRNTSGSLDVDIMRPGNRVAVENITWTDKHKMQEGEYTVLVNNYYHNGGTTGFTAEIEYDGKIYSYTYEKGLRQKERVTVARFIFNRETGITFLESLPTTTASKEVWSVFTHTFQEVSVLMHSPNHWDGEKTGNKHYFFMLKNCINPEATRGFYNEFLNESFTEHRKVFEVLGSKMQTPESTEQLSGLGFSSTKRDSVLCRVTGSFTRTIKIKF